MNFVAHKNLGHQEFQTENALKSKKSTYKTGVINDPLGQTHSYDHYFHLTFVLLCVILKSERTDNMSENSYRYWP